MAAQASAQNKTRLSDWIPLNMKGKPIYAGVNESERVSIMRDKINTVRVQWNHPKDHQGLVHVVEQALNAKTFSRDLRSTLDAILDERRYWADQNRSGDSSRDHDSRALEEYGALEAYTTNEGYKNIFGHINQVFRKDEMNEIEISGAVALVELLTIDLYNLRLANFGCSKYNNFQGIVHRGLSVDQGLLNAFRDLMKEKIQNRNFSVPLAFISTSANKDKIQQFLSKAERGKFRVHWKIHVHELEPKLLAQYRRKYPNSVVSTICAMPISYASEFPDEQEILLRGPQFHLLNMYEEEVGDGLIHVIEMVMLNANRDHATELAHHIGENREQRIQFGLMCAATKYEICASLAEQYQLPDASDYRSLANEILGRLSADQIDAPFNTSISQSWSVPRRSWIGSSLRTSFPKFYASRRETFSKASYGGRSWEDVRTILDQEYEWQRADWCNVPRLYDTREEAANASGFTVLHQAAFNNADPEFVQMLVNYGAWRTLKSCSREGFSTAKDIASHSGYGKLVPILEPFIYHHIYTRDLERLETHLHELMMQFAGPLIQQHAVRLPQLSVMTEMETAKPSLWVPIPGMYGGFILDLHPDMTSLQVMRVANAFPRVETLHTVTVDGVISHD